MNSFQVEGESQDFIARVDYGFVRTRAIQSKVKMANLSNLTARARKHYSEGLPQSFPSKSMEEHQLCSGPINTTNISLATIRVDNISVTIQTDWPSRMTATILYQVRFIPFVNFFSSFKHVSKAIYSRNISCTSVLTQELRC